jgi:hypothetical protein
VARDGFGCLEIRIIRIVSAKNINMDIRIHVFNMDVRWMYSNPVFNIIRIIRQKSDISDIIRIRKNKVPIETI